MSNKSNMLTAIGVVAATALAVGGSVFLTNTGLALIDQAKAPSQAVQPIEQKETELPITVETFAKTKDSFTINLKNGTDNKNGSAGESATGSQISTSENTMYASGNVNVRSSAGTDGEVLGTIPEGEAVTVTGNTDGGWIEVTYNGKTGYISGNYLSKNQTSADGSASAGNTGTSTENAGGSTGASTGGNSVNVSGNTMYSTVYLNVRSGADKNSTVLGTLAPGEAVTVTGDPNSGWVQVYYNGQYGYAGGNYLSDDPNAYANNSSSGNSGGSSNPNAWDDSYMLYDINSRYISKKELKGWDSWSLAALRNEIFARHGRIFTTPSWAEYFSQKTWYVPTYDPGYFDNNMDSFLNDYEWANLEVILKLEG